jgi:tetratricopeptide (TPR) repeat protein
MKLPRENWPTLSKLLDEALEIPESEREHWLAALPPEASALTPTLRQLLAMDSAAETRDFLGSLPRFIVDESAKAAPTSFEPGTLIGRYRLVRPLGTGGMGEVWLATRSDGDLERAVALKLPHAHLLAGALRQRFARERDILAALSHPHIAQLYDAGISESGHPYLAMECIDGIPITQYGRESGLPLESKLALFRQVLDAVQYAHAHFIAHRDLKPSNILVTRGGQAKLLDFGVAKLLSGDEGGLATELTQLGGRAATPDYAAPEQLAGEAVTTAVDVFALGVVLFELVAGTRPFEGARRSRVDVAPLPSQRVSGALRRRLRGDLDAVIAKALESNPAQRYRSVAAFADDLQRFVQNESVSARRVGRITTLIRFARRHRAATALTSGLVVALIVGTVGISWEALQARRAAARAELEATRAAGEARRQKATKDFLTSLFEASDPRIPSDKPRGTITAKELLDAGSSRIEQQFHDDPETAIELVNTMATMYHELSDHPRYAALHARHEALVLEHLGETHSEYIKDLLDDAQEANHNGHFDEAKRELEHIKILIDRAGLAHSAVGARWTFAKSRTLIPDGAERPQRIALLRQAIATYEAVARDDERYALVLNELGLVYTEDDQFELATGLTERAIAEMERRSPAGSSNLGSAYSNLGLDRWYLGDYAGAERAFEKNIQMTRQSVGAGDSRYWMAVVPYAKVIHQSGDRQRSHRLFEDLIRGFPADRDRTLDAAELATIAYAREIYAACLAIEGRVQQSIPVLEAAARVYEKMPLHDYDIRRAHLSLADAYDQVDREADARRMFSVTLAENAKNEAPDSMVALRARERWGRFLLKSGDAVRAESEFRQVLELDRGRRFQPAALAQGGLAQLALARHDLEAADASSSQAIDKFEHVSGARDVRVAPYLWRIRAQVLLASGKAKEARTWAEKALDADRRYDDPESRDIADAAATLRLVTAAEDANADHRAN